MKRALKIILPVLTVLGSLFLLQRLLVPKYVDGVVEGAFVAEYYREEKDHDVIFVGDCEVYENFSPAVLWEEYGINSYIRGSAEQYIWQSYYLLEDTLRYETPRVVVFNIQSLQFSESQREAYNRMTLEGMEWSPAKVKAIFASMKPEEQFLDYVFPILRYHSRWSELTASDVDYMFKSKPVSHNGYYMRVDVRPAENVPTGKPLADYSFGENAWKYLDMMADLCEENGIRLVLIKAPSLYPYWYPQWEEQVEAYAAEKGLPYINFLDIQEETGIDYTTDTYDGGLHMNLSGAEKLSRYMGRYLTEEAGVPDRRGEADLSARWAEKLAAYEAEKQYQYDYYGIKRED
ncbi:MAG: SGNH/GDSL hydrolase family protein [Oscillospiraceae bacterium]|nr:SGNH/GDSL hydrolase family protein [Oscillospiraceae bacterium]